MSNIGLPKPRVLVTGGTGYIGSNLVRRLLVENFEVHVITRSGSDLILLKTELDVVTLHLYDGTTNTLVEVLYKIKPVVVFHLASLFISQHTTKDIKTLIDTNILFSAQLIEAMSIQGVKYLVNTGSSWQNFSNEIYNPVNLYAATKQAFEDIIRYYTEAKGLRVITLRLFDTYGADDPRPKLINLLKQSIDTGSTLEMSPGDQKIDLVYVDDVVECFIAASQRLIGAKENFAEVYSVSSLTPVTLKELVEIFSHVACKPLNVNWGAKPYRFREVMLPWTSGNILPGWEPKISLVDGIRKCLKN